MGQVPELLFRFLGREASVKNLKKNSDTAILVPLRELRIDNEIAQTWKIRVCTGITTHARKLYQRNTYVQNRD